MAKPRTKLEQKEKEENQRAVLLKKICFKSRKRFNFWFGFQSSNFKSKKNPIKGKREKIKKGILKENLEIRKPKIRIPKAEPKDWKTLKKPAFSP